MGVPGDQHVHTAATGLQHLDHLVAGEAAGGRGPNAEDVVACAEASILMKAERSQSEGFRNCTCLTKVYVQRVTLKVNLIQAALQITQVEEETDGDE